MINIIALLYDFCCFGGRPKEQKNNRIFQDVEDLADAEIERLLKHLEIKRHNKINCCY